MKKNWTMRVALLVVALTLITSCFVGGTFAKYVTGASAEDTARVAKFGVTVEADGALFANQYETDEDLNDDEAAIVGKYSVIAAAAEGADADNVVAPGTSFEGGTFALSGTPEVAVRIGYTVEIAAEGWNLPVATTADPGTTKAEAVGEEYFPIIFTINGVQYKVGAEEAVETPAKADPTVKVFDTIEDLIAGIEEDLEAYSAVYAANTDLSSDDVAGLSISWEWPFYVSDENDVKDTALGDAAAAGNAATLDVAIGVTVTQID